MTPEIQRARELIREVRNRKQHSNCVCAECERHDIRAILLARAEEAKHLAWQEMFHTDRAAKLLEMAEEL
jgi:hypothetical protein